MEANRLQSYCNASFQQLRKLGKFTSCRTTKGIESGYTFIDRGSNILAVAHIDTVCLDTNFRVVGDNIIMSPRLDDRLGVYTVVEYLHKQGIKLDVLLCEDEEQMRSTAAYFVPEKQYNWIVEFDRGGDDTVLYQYDYDDGWKFALQQSGFKLGHGSYSDIADLGHLDCMAVNCSAGYYNYHTKNAWMKIDVWKNSIANFMKLYETYGTTRFVFDESKATTYTWDWTNYQGSYGTTYSYSGVTCPSCKVMCYEKADKRLIDYFGYCSDCLIYYDKYANDTKPE